MKTVACYSDRELIFHAVSEIIENVTILKAKDRATVKNARVERGLVRFLTNNWISRSTTGINRALRITGTGDSKFTKSQATRVISALEKAYKTIGTDVGRRFRRDTDTIYKTSKREFARRFKLVAKSLRFDDHLVKATSRQAVLSVSFDIVDEETVRQLSSLHAVAIGDHFPKSKKPGVTRIIQEGVLERGLNKRDAGEFLRKELTRRLGGNIAGIPESIRKQGRQAQESYFRGLAETNTTFARNFAQIQHMDEAEITSFEFAAIIDNLTSQICSQMNGRIFTLEQGKGHREKVLEAENVEQLQDFAPWRKDLSEFGLSAGEKLRSPKASEVLAAHGLSLPPLHFRCRSEVVPA